MMLILTILHGYSRTRTVFILRTHNLLPPSLTHPGHTMSPIQHTAKVLETLEEVIKEVLWEEREKLLTEKARSALEGWVGVVGGDDAATSDKACKLFEVNIAEYFHQLAGTSTGGVLALYRE